MRLQEFYKDDAVSKAIDEHIKQGVPFTECMFRPGSHAFTEFYRRVKQLYAEGKIEVDWQDAELLETDIGECIVINGERVPLDVPIEIAEEAVSPDLFNSLRKGDMLHVNFSSAMSTGEITLQVKSKSRSKKYDLEKITLINPAHPGRVNFFLYKRGDKVTMAQGDLAVTVDAIELAEAVEMCSTECCGKPITECSCGPNCSHCDCYEKNKSLKEDQRPEDNFSVEDVKEIESMMYNNEELSKIKAKAIKLISTKSKKAMQPKKVEWFKNSIQNEKKAMGVVKIMYFLLLSGEGHSVIGSRYSTDRNTYRRAMGEGEIAVDKEAGIKWADDPDWKKLHEMDLDMIKDFIAHKEEALDEQSCGDKGVKPNSPKRGGPKKYYVYVNTPSGNCKKISWGDTTGLSVKAKNRGAVRSFVARHKCKQKNDRTKAGYWACRTPRYKALGVKGGQWW